MEEETNIIEKDCFMETVKGLAYGGTTGLATGIVYNFVTEFENDLRQQAIERFGSLVERFARPRPSFNPVSNLARFSMVGASAGVLLLGGTCLLAHLRNKDDFVNGLVASGLAGIPFAVNSGVLRHAGYASGFLVAYHLLLSLQGGKLVVNKGETVFRYDPE
eukprot:jgi/Galph1/2841/GphlegSOOS_G1529.1